jgi:hypothetical protein
MHSVVRSQANGSFEDALNHNMTEDEFARTFRLTFVVSDIAGQQAPLCERGRSEPLTVGKCRRFITLANEFRLGQLREAFQPIRDGLWRNFNFDPPPRLPGLALEFCACGERLIDVQVLRSLTDVSIPADQAVLFWRVVEEFSQEERAALLKFATGTPRLPADAIEKRTTCLSLDVDQSGRDRLPTASTCFYRLHLPRYSSFENALRCIRIAVTTAATFEND